MGDKLMHIPLLLITMMIHKITSAVDYNQWLKRLNNQLNKPTNQNFKKKSPKLRKRFYKTLGTSVIISPMSNPSLNILPFILNEIRYVSLFLSFFLFSREVTCLIHNVCPSVRPKRFVGNVICRPKSGLKNYHVDSKVVQSKSWLSVGCQLIRQ